MQFPKYVEMSINNDGSGGIRIAIAMSDDKGIGQQYSFIEDSFTSENEATIFSQVFAHSLREWRKSQKEELLL